MSKETQVPQLVCNQCFAHAMCCARFPVRGCSFLLVPSMPELFLLSSTLCCVESQPWHGCLLCVLTVLTYFDFLCQLRFLFQVFVFVSVLSLILFTFYRTSFLSQLQVGSSPCFTSIPCLPPSFQTCPLDSHGTSFLRDCFFHLPSHPSEWLA